MRILMIGHSAERTGAPVSLLQMAEAMKGQGHEIRIGLRRPGPLLGAYKSVAPVFVLRDAEADVLSPADIVRLGLRYDPLMALKCIRNPERPYCISSEAGSEASRWTDEISQWKPDFIYVNTSHCGDLLEWVVDLNVPVITHVREMAETISALDPRRKSIFRRKTDHFLAASVAVRDDLIALGCEADVVTVEAPAMAFNDEVLGRAVLDAENIDAVLGTTPEDLLILGAGTQCSRKGTDLFITVCCAMAKAYTGSRKLAFAWIGGEEQSPDAQDYHALVREAGLEDRLVLTGEVDNPLAFLVRANLLLMTSREDPNPRVVMEAAALGTRTLSFDDNGGAPDFIREYQAGELVAAFDCEAMAGVAVDMLSASVRADVDLGHRVKAGRDVFASAERILGLAENLVKA